MTGKRTLFRHICNDKKELSEYLFPLTVYPDFNTLINILNFRLVHKLVEHGADILMKNGSGKDW